MYIHNPVIHIIATQFLSNIIRHGTPFPPPVLKHGEH